jgi:hypothetical protein
LPRDGIGAWTDDRLPTTVNAESLHGLPAIGFVVTGYVNANVAPGVLANCSAAYLQRRHADCTTAAGPCP